MADENWSERDSYMSPILRFRCWRGPDGDVKGCGGFAGVSSWFFRHTANMQAVIIESGGVGNGRGRVYISDLIPTSNIST